MFRAASRRLIVLFCLIFGIALFSIGWLGLQKSRAATASPPPATQLPFSHNVHVQKAGVQCLFCHSAALRSPHAGLPSLQKCMACHASISVDGSEAQAQVAQVVQAFKNQTPVRWPDVYKQPDFVYFSHRPHLANGVACETCHGDVKTMTLVEKKVQMNMGFCLGCHQDQIKKHPEMPAVEKARLVECVTCHQ